MAITKKASLGIENFFQKVFGIMATAVGVTALTTYFSYVGNLHYSLVNFSGSGLSPTYYIIAFGALALSLWAQARAFNMKASTGTILLFIYSILIGITMEPLIYWTLSFGAGISTIMTALVLTIIMFGCMALFGYKTVKDLSFLGIFLFMGMIGLILVGIASIFVDFGTGFSQLVCLIGVLVFALFTAYDMQNLKNAYHVMGKGEQKDQLAVLGALHLYISFVAMFQYILSLINSRD